MKSKAVIFISLATLSITLLLTQADVFAQAGKQLSSLGHDPNRVLIATQFQVNRFDDMGVSHPVDLYLTNSGLGG